MSTGRQNSSKSAWSTAAVIAAIVVSGTVVAGLLNDPGSDAVAIPGCDEVVKPEETRRINFATVGGGSFDNPEFPWFTEEKAASMSQALAAALPADATIEPQPGFPGLEFDSLTSGAAGSQFGGETTAVGELSVGEVNGTLVVRVQQTDELPGPCPVGLIKERRTIDDGTVVDFWDGGSGSHVMAYTPDGSVIDASADGVLTVDQLLSVATAPGLRVGEKGSGN